MISDFPRASHWLEVLSTVDGATHAGLAKLYSDPALMEERRLRFCASLQCYLATYGDEPVRIFRAPGRINLRGMHVDTHGGWLNLMTHQREVVVVAGKSTDSNSHIANTNPAFAPLAISLAELPQPGREAWGDFILSPEVQSRIAATPGHWRNYVEGAWLRARHLFPRQCPEGIRAVVDSNLPQGAALSSSAALCIALLKAWLAWAELELDDDQLILAAQDAEWYTGSRCGTCDQAAIVLGRSNALIHAALHPGAFTTAGASVIELPEDLRVLAINSYTKRSISGAEKIAYTLNRFAYSMAMNIFQTALTEAGFPEETVVACGRLSNISPVKLGGNRALYRVLREVPERLTLDELRERYALPQLEREYNRYFGDVSTEQRPREIGLRGPLLFGIAESERARHFATALQDGDYARAGRLMTIGHDGDRRVNRDGQPHVERVDDAWLAECAQRDLPIEACPGHYGASSPALDRLVDVALDAGALGASLTGAGIAGTVLALCRECDRDGIAKRLVAEMAGEDYQRTAGHAAPLTDIQLAEAVVENRACAGAGEVAGPGDWP